MTEDKNINDAENGSQDNQSGEKLFTQSDLDSKIQARLERANRKFTDLQAKYDDIQAQIQNADFERLKQKIATENGLSEELATRLHGETEDELKADAESLAGVINVKKSVGRPTNPADSEPVLFTRADIKSMSRDQLIANMQHIEKQLKEGTLK